MFTYRKELTPFMQRKKGSILLYQTFAFLMEQVTRVELAGNSLGSCRHTARRHLHFLRQEKFPLNATYYISFLAKCQRFFPCFLPKISVGANRLCTLCLSCCFSAFLTGAEKLYAVSFYQKSVISLHRKSLGK